MIISPQNTTAGRVVTALVNVLRRVLLDTLVKE